MSDTSKPTVRALLSTRGVDEPVTKVLTPLRDIDSSVRFAKVAVARGPMLPQDGNRRVRVVRPGREGFTGNYGPIRFVDGVSVKAHGRSEINRVAAGMALVDAETGEPVGPFTGYGGRPGVRVTSERPPEPDPAAAPATKPAEVEGLVRIHTREELEAMIEAGKVKQVRAIAVALKASASNPLDMIDRILRAQDRLPSNRIA